MSTDVDKTPLDGKENQIFESIIKTPRYWGPMFRDASFPRIVSGLKNVIQMAKAQFKGRFAGWYPSGNQIGIADLRPHHLGASASWRTNYTSTGFQNYLGDANVTVDEDVFLYFWEWQNQEPAPRSSEIKVIAGTQKLPPIDLRPLRTDKRRRLGLAEPLILTPKTVWEADVRIDVAGNDSLQPIGFVVGQAHRIILDAYYG